MDHTTHLAAEESLEVIGVEEMKNTTSRVRKFVNCMKDSHLMREQFKKTMTEAGDDPLAIIKEASNRQDTLH